MRRYTRYNVDFATVSPVTKGFFNPFAAAVCNGRKPNVFNVVMGVTPVLGVGGGKDIPMSRRRSRRDPPKGLIWLHTCGCAHCKGRAAVCTAGFSWMDRRDPRHAWRHAREDLLDYFDRLPLEVRDALNRSDTNVCSWCAEIWLQAHGAAAAVALIRNVRFVDDARAVTCAGGWSGRL